MTAIILHEESFLDPPPGISDADWHSAMQIRYWASWHIAQLPSGALCAFHPQRWQVAFIGQPAELAEWLTLVGSPTVATKAERRSPPSITEVDDLLEGLI